MNTTFYSYSFGCRVNEAEKEALDRQMVKAGFKFSEIHPDLYIINTCAVTHKAEREARQYIYLIKKKHPQSKIFVTGCSATYWMKNKMYQDLPVDEIIDNTQKEYLVSLLTKRLDSLRGCQRGIITAYPTSKFIGSGRYLMKIQDGCQRYCTFCIVPYLRGMPKSERIKNIKININNLGENVKEIILTAINTEAFGYDTKEKFIDLLKTIIDETNIPRISLGSIHPWSINDEFFEFYKTYKKKRRLVDFFHIPLQSGSNNILKLMKRGYTREEMMEKLYTLRRISPDALIGTDIITGFLEETDKDFQDTYDFLEKSPISKFHVFRFSKRQNTAAYYLARRLTEPQDKEKERRSKALIKLSEIKYLQFLQSLIGKTMDVLFLEHRDNDYQQGLLSNQIPIYAYSARNMRATIRTVKITEYKKQRLFGRIE